MPAPKQRTSDEIVASLGDHSFMARKGTAPLRYRKIDLDKEFKRLAHVLSKDIDELMIASRRGPLEKEEKAKLVDYFELVQRLKQKEEKEIEALSDEEID